MKKREKPHSSICSRAFAFACALSLGFSIFSSGYAREPKTLSPAKQVEAENLAASRANFSNNLQDETDQALRKQIEELTRTEQIDPSLEDGLLAVVSDTHGKVEEFRKIILQILKTAELSGIPQEKIKLVHLGDWGDGEDPQEAAKLARMLVDEFEFDKSQIYSAFGNYEYRGYNKKTVGEEKAWRDEVISNMLPYVTPLRNESGDYLADDEMTFLEIRPGLKLALSHKPLIPLQVSWRAEDRLVSQIPSQINFRNYLSLPERGVWEFRNFFGNGLDESTRPRWEPDTFQTMRRDAMIPSDVDLYFNAHTHRGFVAVLPVKDEDGEYRNLPVANAGTGFHDEKVSRNAPSFATLRIGASQPRVRIHRADQSGFIAFSLPITPGAEWSDTDKPALKPGKALTCSRVLGALNHRKPFATRLKDDLTRLRESSGQ